MRLDEYLLSRVRSKLGVQYLIENDMVKVNGITIKDPSIPADGMDKVELAEASPRLRLDASDSYWRARVIQERVGFVGLGDSVLHVETRDGGFPLLVRDYSGEPFVITAKDNTPVGRLVGTNPFTIKQGEIQTITRARVDILVQELELDAIKCFQTLERLLPSLKSRGRILLFLSSHGRDVKSLREMAVRFLDGMLADVIETFEFKEGVYVYAKKRE